MTYKNADTWEACREVAENVGELAKTRASGAAQTFSCDQNAGGRSEEDSEEEQGGDLLCSAVDPVALGVAPRIPRKFRPLCLCPYMGLPSGCLHRASTRDPCQYQHPEKEQDRKQYKSVLQWAGENEAKLDAPKPFRRKGGQ